MISSKHWKNINSIVVYVFFMIVNLCHDGVGVREGGLQILRAKFGGLPLSRPHHRDIDSQS